MRRMVSPLRWTSGTREADASMRSNWAWHTASVAVVSCAVAAYVLAAGRRLLWLDEAFTVDFAKQDWATMVRALYTVEHTGPLHFLILKPWMAVMGDGERAVRGLSVASAALSLAMTHRFARRFYDARTAFVATSLVASHFLFFDFAVEARCYALTTFLVIASSYLYLRCREGWTGSLFVLYTLANVAGLYAHLWFVFILLGQALHAWRSGAGPSGRLLRRSWLWTALAIGPLIPIAAMQASGGAVSWIKYTALTRRVTAVGLAALFTWDPSWAPPSPWFLRLTMFLTVAAVVTALLTSARIERSGGEATVSVAVRMRAATTALASQLGAAVVLLFTAAVILEGVWFIRYFSIFVVPWVLLFSRIVLTPYERMIARWRGRAAHIVATALLVSFVLCVMGSQSVKHYMQIKSSSELREKDIAALTAFGNELGPDDVIVPRIDYFVLNHYLPKLAPSAAQPSRYVFFPIDNKHRAWDVEGEMTAEVRAREAGRLRATLKAHKAKHPSARVWCMAGKNTSGDALLNLLKPDFTVRSTSFGFEGPVIPTRIFELQWAAATP